MEKYVQPLHTLAAFVPGGFYWKDLQGRYLGCNAVFLDMVLLVKDDLIGKQDADLWPQHAKLLAEQDKIVLKSQNSITLEETYGLADGNEKVLLTIKMPWFNDQKELLGIIANVIDITAHAKKAFINEHIIQKAPLQNVHLIQEAGLALLSGKTKNPELPLPVREKSHILLVEDQSLTAEITHLILADLHCEVDIASDAHTAIALAQQRHYDLIFMDIGLPDLNGYEAAKRIRTLNLHRKQIPIIALTACADNEDKIRCIEAGMSAVLIKPLFREKAEEMLNAFIPPSPPTSIPTAANDDVDWSALSGKIIDLQMGARLFNGNVELAKKMITTLLASSASEIEGLETAYKTQDWLGLEAIVHKLRGGISYCGTPRLQEACARFENHLKGGHREGIALLYKQFLKEIEAVKHLHLEMKE